MTKTDPLSGRPHRSYQKLTERLRQFMAEGHFRDGDKLPPERALAESFGVSRSSVREAIRALAAKGAPRKQARGRDVCPRARHGAAQGGHP